MKKEALKKRGWSEEEIKRAEQIIEARHRIDKSRTAPAANKAVFWAVLAVIIIANFLISLTLIPFLLVLNKSGLDFIIAVIGLAFGILFTFMLNIAHVSRRHHAFAGIIIPFVAVANFIFITYLANKMNDILKLTEVRQNPAAIAALYVAAFIAPFIIDLAIKKYIQKE